MDFHAYRSNKRTYRELRQLSDEICKEHGLSVIPPSQNKGMDYKEYTEAKRGTSWKHTMLGFPASTEFGKRIPKQKFYENLEVSPALRRVFVDQIRLVYWRNKLAASTLNIAAGEAVTEIEVFEVRLNDPQLDEAVLKQIDKEIPYHMYGFYLENRKGVG